MNFPKLRLSTPVAILLILFAVLLGPLFFYFGLMNLIHPDVPAAYLTQNTVVCLALIAAGPGLLFLAVAAYLGSLRQRPSA
jgi:hypothetical protein